MLKILKEIIIESVASVSYFFKQNVYNIGVLIYILCPYLVLYLVLERFRSITVLLVIPVILFILSSLLKRIGNKYNMGDDVPIPHKKFTSESDGEVLINQADIQEIILYLSEVESYLIRKGRLK